MRLSNLRLSSIILGMCMVFLLSSQGYCLYRSDIDPQQARSIVKMQREKDKQRRQMEERKQGQYKRHARPQAEAVRQQQPAKVATITPEKQHEKPRSNGGLIFLVIVIVVISILSYVKRKE